MSMAQSARATIENILNDSLPDQGYEDQLSIPMSAWTNYGGAGNGTVEYATVETGTFDIEGAVWDATADGNDVIRYVWSVPDVYVEAADRLKIAFRARKLDTTGSASENADLSLNLITTVATAASAPALLPPTTITLAAKTTDDTLDDFPWYEFDLSGKGLKRGDLIQFQLGPNQAVGTALALEVIACKLTYRRHAAVLPVSSRW